MKKLGVALLLTGVLISPSQAETVTYLHTDLLGSVVLETDQNRNVVARYEYEPYGLPRQAIADAPGYTGHVHDAGSGLVYMQQRYYDPEVGQFLSVDPVGVDTGTGANFNRYWYGNNNPYKFVDPNGRAAIKFIKQVVKNKGDLIQATIDVGDDVITVFAPSSTTFERIESAISLVSPIDMSDASAIKRKLESVGVASRGRKGNLETRSQNQALANRIDERGGSATTGATPGQNETRFTDGNRSRYSDISATDEQGRPFEVQTVDTDAAGVMTAREAEAAADIARMGDRPVLCVSKKCGQ